MQPDPLPCPAVRDIGASVMRVLVQRVSQAAVAVGGRSVGAIGPGLLLFVGFTHSDDDAVLMWMAEKVCGLRIFPDDENKMNRSVLDVDGGLLVVSQFTPYRAAAKGNSPSCLDRAPPGKAGRLYGAFCHRARTRT